MYPVRDQAFADHEHSLKPSSTCLTGKSVVVEHNQPIYLIVDLIGRAQDRADNGRFRPTQQQCRKSGIITADQQRIRSVGSLQEPVRLTNGAGQDSGAPVAATAGPTASAAVLAEESVVLEGRARTRDDAITEAGRLLVDAGAVEPAYVEAMHARETSVSTHMGNGLAIPHGTNEAKGSIRRTAISFVRYSDPVDWNGKETKFVVGIAGVGDEHLALLGRIAQVFLDPAQVSALEQAATADEVVRILSVVEETRSGV